MTDTITEEWVYIGRRILSGGVLGKFFVDPDGRERGFKKFAVLVIGGTYRVKVSRDGDSVSVHGAAEYVPGDQDERTPEWRLLDQAAYAEHQGLAFEKKMARENTDIGALTPREVNALIYLKPNGAAVLARVLRYLTSGVVQ